MNSFEVIDPKLLDVRLPEHDGYPEALAKGDTQDVLKDICGDAARSFPQSMWIEPRDWADKAADNDRHGTWPRNYIDRFTNQSPSHECVYHSACTGLASCWNRQLGIIYPDGAKKEYRYPESGKYKSVWFSPLSGYSPANPRQWGGSSVRGSLERLTKYGLLPDKIQPADYGFKHTLQGTSGRGNLNQSGGGWVRERDFPEGWEQTAKLFRVVEAVFADTWEQAVCLVLHGIHYHVGRDGHAVPWGRYLPGQGMEYNDSYDVYRYDSMRTIREAWRSGYGIISMTQPDDYSKLGA